MGGFQEFLDDVRANPFLLAVSVMILVIVIVLLHKRVVTGSATPGILESTPTPSVPTGSGSDNNPTQPTQSVTNLYPVTQQTIINPHKSPAPKGTSGYSDNFSIYTTQYTDTLTSITAMAGWTKQGPGYLVGYRNNAEVLSSWNVNPNNYTTTLPAGMQLSI